MLQLEKLIANQAADAGEGCVVALTGVRYEIEKRIVLDKIDLEIVAGHSVAVCGPSGSGKSTLISLVLGLLSPDSGTILVAGVDITRASNRIRAEVRRRSIGTVFQSGELMTELDPEDNVALAAMLQGASHRRSRQAATELLRELGVPAGVRTANLSGGERQRVSVARALINEPRLIIADEPTGALDEALRDVISALLYSMATDRNCALLVVTHDQKVASQADQVMDLVRGRLVTRAAVPGQ